MTTLTGNEDFLEWKQKITYEILAELGEVFRLVTESVTDEDGERREVTVEDLFPIPEVPNGGANAPERMVWTERVKTLMKSRADTERAVPRAVGMIMRSLSDGMEAKVRACPSFDKDLRELNLSKIWATIEEAALGDARGRAAKRAKAVQEFGRLKQGGKTLEDFTAELDLEAKKIATLGAPVSQADMVYQLLLNLDEDTYGGQVASWLTEGQIPQTFVEAVKTVATWTSARRYLPQYAPISKAKSDPEIESAFGMVGKTPGPKRGGGPCFVCGGDHYANQCPDRVVAKAEAERGPRRHATKRTW